MKNFYSTLLLCCIATFGIAQWTAQTPPNGFYADIDFFDNMNGCATGADAVIACTSDGGTTWNPPTTNPGLTLGTNNGDINILGVELVSATTGWGVGQNGRILTTIDGGDVWTEQTNPASGNGTGFNDVFFVDANTGWVVGSNATIVLTTNAGDTWVEPTTNPTSQVLNGVFFVDANTGWIVGNGGVILKSTDGGDVWVQQTSGVMTGLQGVYFVDANTGWACGSGGVILKTENGGMTWTAQTSNTGQFLWDVHFANSMVGWASGNSGTVLYTADGGTTWTDQSTNVPASAGSSQLRGIDFTDGMIGWACGSGNTILRTINAGLPVELTFFKGEAIETGNRLQWQTATEENNAGFEVQRSKDAQNWETLGFVKGHGTTVEIQNYKWLDDAPLANTNYYRLKQMDSDGQYEYSKMVSINYKSGTAKDELVISPNPVTDVLNYQVASIDAVSSVKLFDAYGKLLKVAPQITGTLSLEDVNAGTYFLVVQTVSNSMQQIVVKQ